MPFVALPATAAWQHQAARSGFEVVTFQPLDDGWRIEGTTTAVEDGRPWVVDYRITLDATWTTLGARVTGRSASGARSTVLEADGAGHWLVDGEAAPHMDGCLDVDLESSAVTNALPVRRMGLAVGARAAAPAAYVRTLDLAVERLEQDYVRTADQDAHQRYDCAAPHSRSRAAWCTTTRVSCSPTPGSPSGLSELRPGLHFYCTVLTVQCIPPQVEILRRQLEQRAQRLPQVADQLSFAVAARSLVHQAEGLLAMTADDIFS